MAKYRQIHTEFWSDGFVLDLTPEEKYFYIYLMTNSKTTQCGIYELPKRIIETETGYNRETVDKLLIRFQEYKKVNYCDETKEIMILNWAKYNQPGSPNAIKCVNRELKNVKNRKFVRDLYLQYCSLGLEVEKLFYEIEEASICMDKNNENYPVDIEEHEELPSNNEDTYGDNNRGFEGAYKDIGSNEIINNKEEVINKSNKEEVLEVINNNSYSTDHNSTAAASANLQHVLLFFQRNIHKPTEAEINQIVSWTDDFTCDVIILAIEEAVNYNARFIKYIERILCAWLKKGIKTPEAVRSYQEKWEKSRVSGNKKDNEGGWNCYPQREYDFDKLERGLLGWDSEDSG